jgi:hypothetical protein
MERVVAVGGMSAIAFLFMMFKRCSTKILIREVLNSKDHSNKTATK